jgi:exodeoxyribonuclease-5
MNLNSFDSRKVFNTNLEKYFKSKEFEQNPEYTKIIAWRNKTVSTMNLLVRRTIYGEESLENKILVGEKLIANNPIIENENIIFNTNDEFTVESFEVKEHRFKIDDIESRLKYYETRVSYLSDDDKNISVYIDILHEDSESNFNVIAGKLKKIAIEKKGKDRTWIKYYSFLRKYADVSYAYAITAHKSQGSTYEYTFVLDDDIDMNTNIVERNRIKYTAYTRSSKKLYILKRF